MLRSCIKYFVIRVRKAFSALDKSYSSWKKTPNEETGSNMLLMPCCALFALEAAAHEVSLQCGGGSVSNIRQTGV